MVGGPKMIRLNHSSASAVRRFGNSVQDPESRGGVVRDVAGCANVVQILFYGDFGAIL